MCELTYANHFKTVIQAILPDGETLGPHIGPDVVFIKTDGDDAAYVEAVKQGIAIADPLDTPAVLSTLEAKTAKAEKTAQEHAAKAEKAAQEHTKAAPANAKEKAPHGAKGHSAK